METEIVWLPKDLARKVNSLKSDAEQKKVIDEYIEESRREIKINLESLEDDVIKYKGLMTSAKIAFREAKDEQLKASYDLWENFEKDLPAIKEKVDLIKQELLPLKEEIKAVQDMMSKINSYSLEQLLRNLTALAELRKNNKDVFDFMLTYYQNK